MKVEEGVRSRFQDFHINKWYCKVYKLIIGTARCIPGTARYTVSAFKKTTTRAHRIFNCTRMVYDFKEIALIINS